MIHDPNFFVLSSSPDTIPRFFVNMDDARSQRVIFKAVYTEKMNKPKYPCISDKSYSFTICVANSVSAKVGCKLELDSLSSEEFPNCTTVREIIEIADIYEKMFTMRKTDRYTEILTLLALLHSVQPL